MGAPVQVRGKDPAGTAWRMAPKWGHRNTADSGYHRSWTSGDCAARLNGQKQDPVLGCT